MENKLSVLMTTEGTYPFAQGGVSTWCDIMIKRLHQIDFTVFSITMDPFITQKFDMGPDAKLVRVPLWGTEEPSEHLDTPFSSTYLAKQRTTDEVITERFLPKFSRLVSEIVAKEKKPQDLAKILVELYDFFAEYDYKVCFKSQLTWNAYKSLMNDFMDDPQYQLGIPDVYCLIQSLGWIYRFFNIINTPIPRTTVTHSSAAAFCGLPCVIAKVKYGTPFLLTEHGVYLREQYLSLSKRGYPSFLNSFLIRMIHSVTGLCYEYADQISPVCEYNTRWERQVTDRHERIKVIYNGVDHIAFSKVDRTRHERPTVVTMARIDPIKDMFTLLKTAAKVRESIPDVRFIIYGSVSVPSYYDECLALREELGLDSTVEFKGHTSDMISAYSSGDILLQTSISEAFPYSVIEAMLSGLPVVSTDVGGIPEAVGETGILTAPRDTDKLAAGVVQLLTNSGLRAELGADARDRALTLFTLRKSLEEYLKSYLKLALSTNELSQRESAHIFTRVQSKHTPKVSNIQGKNAQRTAAERAYAYMDYNLTDEAIRWFRESIECQPMSVTSAILWTELANIYNVIGQGSEAADALLRAEETYASLVTKSQTVFAERSYALLDWNELDGAIQLMWESIDSNPESVATPALLADLAMMYELAGQPKKAAGIVHKFELLLSIRSA